MTARWLLAFALLAPLLVGCASSSSSLRTKVGSYSFEQREGTLVLRLGSGDTVRLVDRPLSKDLDVVTYRYSRWLDQQRLHVVWVARYESVEYLLVDDRSGAQTRVVGDPVVSPDGHRLACLVLNLVNTGFARLEIWRRTEAGSNVSSTRTSCQTTRPRSRSRSSGSTPRRCAWSSRTCARPVAGPPRSCAATGLDGPSPPEGVAMSGLTSEPPTPSTT